MKLGRSRRDLASWLLGGAAIVAAVITVLAQRRHLGDALQKLGPGAVLLSLAFGVASDLMLVVMWRRTLAGFGARPHLAPAVKVFFVGQLGKYIPGSVWPMLTQMELGHRENIARRTMVAANLTMLALSLVVGSSFAVILLPLSGSAALGRYLWAVVLLVPLLLCLHPRVIPKVLNWALRKLGREQIGELLRPRDVAAACAWSALSWLLIGIHLYVIVDALGYHGTRAFTTAVGGMALAVVIGILAIPAPAGAGIRDVALVLALSATTSGSTALAAALVSRVLLIVADVLLGLSAAGIRTSSCRRKTLRHISSRVCARENRRP